MTGGLAAEPLAFKGTPGKHLDVLLDGKVAARYMYEHDTSAKERAYETYKPYLHVIFEKDIPADGKLEVRYRFLILDGDFPGRETVGKAWTESSK